MTFVARMYLTAAKVKELSYFTRLNLDFHSKICTGGIPLSPIGMDGAYYVVPPHVQVLQLIAVYKGAFMEGQWFQWPWPPKWESVGIMVKELAPIVLSCIVWDPKLATKPHFSSATMLG